MVQALLRNPGAAQGQEASSEGARYFAMNKAATFAVAKGDILVKDTTTAPDSLKIPTPGAAIPGPFYRATEASTTTQTRVSVAVGGMWYVVADDAIEPGDDVMLSTSTAGHVMKSTAVTTVALSQARVGVCLGFVDTAMTGAPTASTAGDLVLVDANPGYRG